MTTLFLLLALTVASTPQLGSPSAAGLWTARVQGTTFVRLELTSDDGTTRGNLSLGNFQIDREGIVIRAEAAGGDPKPIFDVIWRGSVLTFSRQGGDDIERFEFRLLGAGRAELHVLLSDEDLEEAAAAGIPAPKPIPLAKS